MIGLPSDTHEHPNLLVQDIADDLNTGIFIEGLQVHIQNAMFVDDNLLAEFQEEITLDIATRVESLFILLGEENSLLCKIPLSMDKYYDSICSYLCTQLGILINTRSLTLSIPDDKKGNLIKIILTA